MLKSLEIKKFKSLKDVRLEFTKGLNLIMGNTQAGKSACLQAAELLFKNRPLGGNYIYERKPGTVVVKGTFDDCTVEVLKLIVDSKDGLRVKKTSYVLNEAKVFNGLADEVKAALNISDVNLQGQPDDSFLITTSGGEFSRTVSKFIGMDEVSIALTELKGRLSACNTLIDLMKEKVKDDKEELKKYILLPSLEMKYKRYKKVAQELKDNTEEAEELDEFVGEEGRLARLLAATKGVKGKFKKYFAMEKREQGIEKEIVTLQKYLQVVGAFDDIKSRVYATKGRYLERIKAMGACPFCFGTIDKNNLKKIKEGL